MGSINGSVRSSSPLGDDRAATPYLQGTSALFESGAFSDIVVRCGGREWNAHKTVLCTQSDFFLKACEGQFKVSIFFRGCGSFPALISEQESKDNCIELHDDKPDVVDAMLRFFYTFDYSTPSKGAAACVFHVHVFALAEKYFIEQLQSLAAKKFGFKASSDWDTDDFADAIAIAYSATTDTHRRLRKKIIAVVTAHSAKLYGSKECDKFLEMSAKVPEFATEMAIALAAETQKRNRLWLYACPNTLCSETFWADMSMDRLGTFAWYCYAEDDAYTMTKTKWKGYRVEVTEEYNRYSGSPFELIDPHV